MRSSTPIASRVKVDAMVPGKIALSWPEDGIVLYYGWDWNTLIPYYTQRRAIMVPSGREEDVDALQTILAGIPAGQVSALVMQETYKQNAGFVGWRTRLLNLSAAPVAVSAEGDLYLPAAGISSLQSKLAGRSYPDVTLDFSNPPERPDQRLVQGKYREPYRAQQHYFPL